MTTLLWASEDKMVKQYYLSNKGIQGHFLSPTYCSSHRRQKPHQRAPESGKEKSVAFHFY